MVSKSEDEVEENSECGWWLPVRQGFLGIVPGILQELSLPHHHTLRLPSPPSALCSFCLGSFPAHASPGSL